MHIFEKGYNEFQYRIEHLKYRKLSTADRVKAVFEKRLGIVKKTTIERTLKELLETGFIEKVGKGRATGYTRK